jgi:hypothetical protein
MSHDEPPTMKGWEKYLFGYMMWIWLAPLVPVVFIIVLLILSRSLTPTTENTEVHKEKTESRIESVQDSLSRQTDLNTCLNALQTINVELNEKPALRPPALTKEQKDWLHEQIGSSPDELAEIDSRNYTRLDSPHLERCFLLRDAARSLEVKSSRGRAADAAGAEAPLHLAQRAFAWVMRQVRLRQRDGDEAPPAFALRRGWGTALERALVFLALLEQLGDLEAARPEFLGCLLEVPDSSGRMVLWACGVVVGDGTEVYVFDPRLGLPLPGPGGKGIATLAALRKQPDLLTQLHLSDKLRYDVTGKQIEAAQARLVCPLSALAPRMLYLQEKLLAPAVTVRLSADAASELERLRKACAAGADKPMKVGMAKEKTALLRRFLAADEGGVDTTSRKQRFTVELVPMKTLPAQFRDERKYPANSALGQRVRLLFAAPFISSTLDAEKPRDLLLRGRYSSVVPALVSERDRWRNVMEQRANAVDLQQKADEWWERMTHAYAVLLRAKQGPEREQAEKQVNALWSEKHAASIYVLLYSAAAVVRNAEAAYQLGLCSQEQAEQMQARLEVPLPGSSAAAQRVERDKAKQAWESALNSWKQLEEEFPNHPDLASARRLQGRAEALFGDKKAAIADWKELATKKDLSGSQSDLEKLAALYLAQQLEKQ